MLRERNRRLAAVWFADIVGYSTLSARDEDAALSLVDVLQRASRAATEAHGGRVVKFSGDAALTEFESVDGALRAALAVQTAFAADATTRRSGAGLRIGLHLGEVTEGEDGDIYGDGVNVAARLQSKAQPGQVVVSRAVRDAVRGRGGYAVRRRPTWRHLKGLGLARTFVVDPPGGSARSGAKVSPRAIAVGLTAALVAFFTLMLGVAMSGGGLGEGGDAILAEDELRDGSVLLNLGMEQYYAEELEDVVESLEAFASPPLLDHPSAPKALRFLARTHLRAGRPELARATLAQMVSSEPPMALLIPTAEADTLMALYYDVRREALRERAMTPSRVAGVVVFDLEVVLDSPDEALADLGSSVAQMIASELESGGVSTQYLWTLMLGFTGEQAYEQLEDPGARSAGAAPSHALFGRVVQSDAELVLSVQVYEVASGTPASTRLVTGVWPDALFDMVESLGRQVAADLLATPGG